MAELTTAAEMANAAGIDADKFREALRGSDFPWHKRTDDWTVEIDSPEHESMRTVLVILLLKRKNGQAPDLKARDCPQR
ncbi:hypothetical protein [Mesorhizobium sp. NZP2077]|uniref:hypothetical protein n=1 Tax=Mesorhizobium sp. NZP2077 TaxID=2483404 RepID=UPI001553885D|nr:hypothetical protein [Mesorhizobium sp. NZP2077]QKC81551.1 hypothetical protein EB232_07725 [Mesorhizobium sp. NZP2077]QKD14998.1 hypothetical protein HGP13_07605 [Mesorhizobium sp. NZP2077]